MTTSFFHRGLLLGAALLVGTPLTAAAKCRDPFQPLFVIDGRQATRAEFTELTTLHPETIAGIEIRCWNPADSTLNLAGIGMPVTLVVTKPVLDELIADLREVSAAQRTFFAQRSTFAPRLSELGIRARAEDSTIELTAGPAGWSATATRPLMVHHCAVVVGDATPPTTQRSLHAMQTELVTTLVENVPACFVSVDPTRKYPLAPER